MCFFNFFCALVQEEKAKLTAAPADKGKEAEEKKDEGGGGEEKKEEAPPPPPPLPEEVVMRVYMHCEGCARKVKKILKGFDGNGFSCSIFCCSIVPLCSWYTSLFLNRDCYLYTTLVCFSHFRASNRTLHI